MSDALSPQVSTPLLVTISADKRWLPMTTALTVRFAEHAGFAAAPAREIGAVIEAAARTIIEHVPDASVHHIRLSYATGAGELEIDIRYRHGPGARQLTEALAHATPAGAALDAIDVRELPTGGCVCRLVRRIPGH